MKKYIPTKAKRTKFKSFVYSLTLTILGGVGLFIATLILSSVIVAPPTKAEFDAHKAEAMQHLKGIDEKLQKLDDKQTIIINHLIGK